MVPTNRPKTQHKPNNTTPGSTTSLAPADYAGRSICGSSLFAHCKISRTRAPPRVTHTDAHCTSMVNHTTPPSPPLPSPKPTNNPPSPQYLLNYLDRGNIGNSKLLNSETGDSLLQQTHMNNHQYAVAVSFFAAAYALFEVPSNYIMKRHVRPSRWLTFLLCGWGILTIGFAGVQNFTQVTVLRVLIGVFEAGFFPGRCFIVSLLMDLREGEHSCAAACLIT